MISVTSNFIEDPLLAGRIPRATKPRHANRQSFEDTLESRPGPRKEKLVGRRETGQLVPRLQALPERVVSAPIAADSGLGVRSRVNRRAELVFPASDDDRRQAVAKDVDRRAPHVHKLINPKEKKKRLRR